MAKTIRAKAPASTTRVEVTSVAEFVKLIQTLPAPSGSYTYRGVRDRSWLNKPGILRNENANLLRHERDAIRELQAVHPQEFASDQTMFDRLVRMQHYRLPTRLLDVTANPLVALYYATDEVNTKIEPSTDGVVWYIEIPRERMKYYDSDTVSCIANLANLSPEEKKILEDNRRLAIEDFNKLPVVDRLVQFIRLEKPAFRPIINPDELDRVWFVVTKLSNRRIIAQTGAFLIYGLATDRISVPAGSAAIKFRSIRILKEAKPDIRRELEVLGINEAALFPEIEYAAGRITARYR